MITTTQQDARVVQDTMDMYRSITALVEMDQLEVMDDANRILAQLENASGQLIGRIRPEYSESTLRSALLDCRDRMAHLLALLADEDES